MKEQQSNTSAPAMKKQQSNTPVAAMMEQQSNISAPAMKVQQSDGLAPAMVVQQSIAPAPALVVHDSTTIPPEHAPFHIDEPKAKAYLGTSSDDERMEGWYLDTGATNHMTGRVDTFAEIDQIGRASCRERVYVLV